MYIGPSGTNQLGDFGLGSTTHYGAQITPFTLFNTRKEGYFLVMLIKTSVNPLAPPYISSSQNFPRKMTLEMQKMIMESLVDSTFFRGSGSTNSCPKLRQLVAPTLPSDKVTFMDDCSNTNPGISQSFCSQEFMPHSTTSWQLTEPSKGEENKCVGAMLNHETSLLETSEPGVIPDLSDDCNEESPAAYVNTTKHNLLLTATVKKAKAVPAAKRCSPGNPDMSDTQIPISVSKKRKLTLTTNPSSNFCKIEDFKTQWESIIKNQMSHLLPWADINANRCWFRLIPNGAQSKYKCAICKVSPLC